MVNEFLVELSRVSDQLFYLAITMAFACAYALSYMTHSLARGVNAFFLFVLLALASVVVMKFTGFSITGDRNIDAVFAMTASMSAVVVALTVLLIIFNAVERRLP